MKAIKIIEELTRSNEDGRGVFSVDSEKDMARRLFTLFGSTITELYDPHDIFHAKVGAGETREFVYSYDTRFDRKYDRELYAILATTEENDYISVIYIYEIE